MHQCIWLRHSKAQFGLLSSTLRRVNRTGIADCRRKRHRGLQVSQAPASRTAGEGAFQSVGPVKEAPWSYTELNERSTTATLSLQAKQWQTLSPQAAPRHMIGVPRVCGAAGAGHHQENLVYWSRKVSHDGAHQRLRHHFWVVHHVIRGSTHGRTNILSDHFARVFWNGDENISNCEANRKRCSRGIFYLQWDYETLSASAKKMAGVQRIASYGK